MNATIFVAALIVGAFLGYVITAKRRSDRLLDALVAPDPLPTLRTTPRGTPLYDDELAAPDAVERLGGAS